ncbi:Pikachurin [Clonorchis sinensis]|uniref:Pikachurin n=1 Tax=Clonorchis sinensis TaxID=79923 RepID=A0A8T1M3N5_CLOSI|nr:Pikachurin [Clonorchis sinensis]
MVNASVNLETHNMLALMLLLFCGILPHSTHATNNTTLLQDQSDDWSMIMEVEVEDPNAADIKQKKLAKVGLDATPCGDILCLNRAKCLMAADKHGPYKCVCQIGFSGTHCEQTNSGFRFPKIEEGGYLKFIFPFGQDLASSALMDINVFHIGFEIKPDLTNGRRLIVYHRSKRDERSFMLNLELGHLVFRFTEPILLPQEADSSNVIDELRHSQPLIASSQWYSVEFGRQTDGRLYLSLNKNIVKGDESKAFKKAWPQRPKSRTRDPKEEDIFIGGHSNLELLRTQDPYFGRYLEENFVGCIQHIYINGEFMDPRRRSFVGDAVEGYGLTDCAHGICDQNRCKNNGTCAIISGSSFECQCPMGTKGLNCQNREELHMLQYTGRSYTEYFGFKGTSQSNMMLLITFKPVSPNGLLLYQGYSHDRRGDFLTVLLVQSHIEVQFDLGSGTANLRSPSVLMMNTWHTVRFWLNGRQGFLVVDNEDQVTTAFSYGPLVQLTLDQHMFIGSHPDADLTSAHLNDYLRKVGGGNVPGFHGCIQQLQLNGQSVDLLRDALRGVNMENCLGHPCARPDTTCMHSSHCRPEGEDFTCVCFLGYVGKKCDTPISTTRLNRPSFGRRSILRYGSPDVITKLNMPHFDIYLDIRLRSTKLRTVTHPNFWNGEQMGRRFQTLLACLTTADDRLLIGIDEQGSTHLFIDRQTVPWFKQIHGSLEEAGSNQTSEKGWEGNDGPKKLVLSVNMWHKMMLKRRGNTYLLFVNGTKIGVERSDRLGYGKLSYNMLSIGNVNANHQGVETKPKRGSFSTQSPDVLFVGFNGCIENLHINGRQLSTAEATSGESIAEC